VPARESGRLDAAPSRHHCNDRVQCRATGDRATGVRRIVRVRSNRCPKWACRRAPTTRGGHCSNAGGLSTVLRDPLYSNGLIHVFAAKARAMCILSAPHRFPEPCGHFGLTSPHQSTSPEGQNDRCRLDRVDIVRSRRTSNLSRVSVIVDRHEGQEPGRRQLLAVHQLRRNLERVTDRGGSAERGSMAMTSSGVVRRLLELIAALDRRVPQFSEEARLRSPVMRRRSKRARVETRRGARA
jgi:hypothetical protein